MNRSAMRSGVRAIVWTLLWTALATAEALDPKFVDDFAVIEIVTEDLDGDRRETKVWVGEFEGRVYVRTNDSRWFINIQREPKFVLRAGGRVVPVIGEVVLDDELRRQVDDTFREKYGWQVRMMEFFGGTGGKNLLRLSPRSAED